MNLGFPSLRTGAKGALPFIGLRPWRNGRRAALRSLWGNTRESSSLSGRTKSIFLKYFRRVWKPCGVFSRFYKSCEIKGFTHI